MSELVVNVSQLGALVKEVKRSGCTEVLVSFSEADDELPACLEFSACLPNEPDIWYEFDPIGAVENSDQLCEACLNAPHASSDMI